MPTEFEYAVLKSCEHAEMRPVESIAAIEDTASGCYSQALFELSRPLRAGDYGTETCDEWDTFKITYKQLI